MKNKRILQIGLGAAVFLVVLFIFTTLTDDTRSYLRVDTSVAMEQLNGGNVEEAQIDDREQRVRLTLREPITVDETEDVEEVMAQYPARATDQVFSSVRDSGAESYTTEVTQDSFLMSMLGFLLPMLILFGLLFFFLTRMQSGGMFGMGGNKAKELTEDNPTNTFADVAGAEEAVDELQEVVDFLRHPEPYEQLGAKIPKGVLLSGPPGTGKTLLARAVAGEAGVPFYSISGSDFVEMFVGVGASRVRDLFKKARENSPCIIFIDEIDAVGRQRGSGTGGGHDEREQTLNQLLVEMDGFGDREGVILIAATNRPDILDPALLRPGRFDRQIPVSAPDVAGREQILNVHAKGKPLAPDVDLHALAQRTAGMSGADLANVLNEAALLTARIGGNVITPDALEEATDRVIGGPRRSSMIISEQEKKVTAYHEGGHTLAAWALQDIERVYKVTILARGRTGGHSMIAGNDDKSMYNRDELFARLVFAMGGRAAEEVVFGEPTTGASADIEQATKIARAMVTEYGMSPQLGTVKYGEENGDPFSRMSGGGTLDYSPEVAAEIDTQVAYLIDLSHRRAYDILAEHRDYLDTLAEKLLEKETLRRPDLEALFDGIEPQPIGDLYPDDPSSYPRQEGREPVKTPVELARERGEEPPKRMSLLEASKKARAARQAELEAKGAGAARPLGADAPAPAQGPGPGSSAAPAPGHYGDTPPPADWHVPGWPPQNTPQQPHHPLNHQPPTEDNEGGSTASREHPGMRNYAPGQSPQDSESEPDEKKNGQRDEPMIGFRLPEHERPEHPETPTPSDDETTQIPRVIDPLDAADDPDLKLPDASPRPPQDPDSPTTKE